MSLFTQLVGIFTQKSQSPQYGAADITEYASDRCFRDLAKAYQNKKTAWAFALHGDELLTWAKGNKVDIIPSKSLEARIHGFLRADQHVDTTHASRIDGFQIVLGHKIYEGVWIETPQNYQTYIKNENGEYEGFYSTHPPRQHKRRTHKPREYTL